MAFATAWAPQQKVGNAVPPRLAAHLASAATGIPLRQALAAAA